ncbi:uncharacterized protein LOC118406742 [Branchiostoma floridae]|uniref:Uncharacterized protein LOC118406742 n=1 Tax=Branchiostoma floridae TaxID=7739 RepID=A0A9J7HNL8_BRAFL|nr:uncharacterized protein LOC118406742 [Branchiostoma floridae]XP_035662934.1 uncharacterized protein LOC118406742 [Branchiostoma floridae]
MSSTLTGVCGLSWEVTMSVLPRLYMEEVLSELQRRKIAVAREKVRHSDLSRLLHEVMVREYEQLQQHLRTFYIHTEKEFSPQTRAQEIHYVHGHQRNLPGSQGINGNASQGVARNSPNQENLLGTQGSHGNASQGVARNSPNQEKSPTMAVQENIPAQTVAKNTLPGNLQGMQGVNSSQGIVQNSPNQGISPITERQQSLQPRGKFITSQNVSQKSTDQLVQGPSPITSMQQNLQAPSAETSQRALNTSPGNLPRIQCVYSTASQSILQNSSNQHGMALITATQHNHPAVFPQAMGKKSSPGNVRETEGLHGNASQSLAQNSPNPLVHGILPVVTSSTQHDNQAQLIQTVRTLKNNVAGNSGGRQSNTQQSVPQNTPGQPVQGTSPTTATHQSLKVHFAQSLANLKNNLQGIKPSIVTTRTGAPVHGKSFTYSQPSRPQMQVSPQVQSSPEAMPPQLAQMIRNGPNLLNTPTGLLRGHANPVVKFPSGASAGQPSSQTSAPIDPVAWGRSFSSTMKSQQEAESGQQGLQKDVVTNSNSSNSIHANLLGEVPSAARQPSPQPPGSQTDAPIDQCAWARSFSIAMKSQQEVVSGHQGLQKGVVTDSSHGNASPGVVQSSPNQPERESSPETETPLQNLQTQFEQAVQEARNSLPGASMPLDVHAGQGGADRSSTSDTSFTMAQTLQGTSVQDNMHSNTSPYDVGQVNQISEPTEDRTKNHDHQDMQGTFLTNNCDATTDVSFHSAATNAEREEDKYNDTRSTNATTQESVASQQTFLTLNQQSEHKTSDMHDSIRQHLPEQDTTQSSQDNGREHSVQEPSETENTHNLPSSNVVVKIEQEDDYWSVPCTTSTANSHVSDSPSPCVVVKTEKDDNIETDSTLPLDYSAGTSMERSSTVRTENDLEEAWRQERLDDHSSPEQSQVTTSAPVQQVMPQGLSMTHTDQQESTSSSLTLSESLTIRTTPSQESRHYAVHSSAGLPDLDMNAYEFRDNSRNLSQKRKTVRALLDDLKKAKQLKSDGVTNEEDPMGIVSAMKDWREGRRYSQTNRREDVGPSVPLVGEGSVQQLRTGNMQGGEQFSLASAEADRTVRAPRGVLHKCMFCPFETRLKTNLQYHLRDHAEINVYRCGMCSFSAATKQTLDDHVATRHHEELPFMCGVCGYRTGVKENLSTHMWVVHKAGKSFQCSLCEYSTSYKTRLETHMINHHF